MYKSELLFITLIITLIRLFMSEWMHILHDKTMYERNISSKSSRGDGAS